MSEQPISAASDEAKKTADPRGRSTIEFPYLDLSNAVEVAHAIKAVGGTSADWNQLAVKLSMNPTGGGFRLRIMAAKVFGILEYARGHVELTELGIRIVDPHYDRQAKVDAFLRVPLFRSLFDKLNGQALPPASALERMAEQAGVAPKQKDKARQVFIRSAKQVGMFDLSSDRLAMPPGLNGQTTITPSPSGDADRRKEPPPPTPQGSHALPPFIKGLLDKLPTPDTEWAIEARAKWLTTAANIFDLMYLAPAGADGKTIEIAVNEPPKSAGGSP